MDIGPKSKDKAPSHAPSVPALDPDVVDAIIDKPDRAIDTFIDETPPPQDWKHPDDGKSLSDQDVEWPLKP